jgi:hypothetical protein
MRLIEGPSLGIHLHCWLIRQARARCWHVIRLPPALPADSNDAALEKPDLHGVMLPDSTRHST